MNRDRAVLLWVLGLELTACALLPPGRPPVNARADAAPPQEICTRSWADPDGESGLFLDAGAPDIYVLRHFLSLPAVQEEGIPGVLPQP